MDVDLNCELQREPPMNADNSELPYPQDYTDDADLNRELHWEPPMDAENSELPYPQITQMTQI